MSHLLSHLNPSPQVTTLANAIYNDANPPEQGDHFIAACAIYLATAVHTPKSSVPLSTILKGSPNQLRITYFFPASKNLFSSAGARSSPQIEPSSAVHNAHRAFITSARVWRDLSTLFLQPIFKPSCSSTSSQSSSPKLKIAWLFYLVCKNLLCPTDLTVASSNAFPLLLVALVEAGFVSNSSPKTTSSLDAVSAAFHVPIQTLSTFQAQLLPSLPPPIADKLPFFPNASEQLCATAIIDLLNEEYDSTLKSLKGTHVADERIFLETPDLLSTYTNATHESFRCSTEKESPIITPKSTIMPTPPQKRRLDRPGRTEFITPVQTPQSRIHAHRNAIPVTPVSRDTRYFAISPNADSLNTLAAVALSTPTSPAPSVSTHTFTPTPVRKRPLPRPEPSLFKSSPLETWLVRMVESRPEVNGRSEDDGIGNTLEEVDEANKTSSTNQSLPTRTLLTEEANRFCQDVVSFDSDVSISGQPRDAIGVYFTAFDGILEREKARLRSRGDKQSIASRLIRNDEFHKSLMALSWECVVAIHGRNDMRMLWTAMHALKITPFALSKVVESFVKALPECPMFIVSHMSTCDARINESLVWTSNSELVQAVIERESIQKAARGGDHANKKACLEGTQRCDQVGSGPKHSTDMSGSTVFSKSKEFSIEIAYKKLLYILSSRIQELLRLLGLERLTAMVWLCMKRCVWERWHLLVDRHADQIMMCCIYAITKVSWIDLPFRDIVAIYRTMRHVRDPSFTSLMPDLVRSVSLTPYPYGAGDDNFVEGRGDIIKFYNKVFVKSMKGIVLSFEQVSTSTLGSDRIPANAHRTETNDGPVTPPDVEMKAEAERSETGMDIEETGKEVPDCQHKDVLEETILTSPMRTVRPQALSRRIGPVTVSTMNPTNRTLLSSRQSPKYQGSSNTSEGVSAMTPGTRTLFAFGESPMQSLERYESLSSPRSTGQIGGSLNRQIASPTLHPRLLTFDADDATEQSTLIKNLYTEDVRQPGVRRDSTAVGDAHAESESL